MARFPWPLLAALLLLPRLALAHGNTRLEEGSPSAAAVETPDLSEVEAAIEAAATEFEIPLPILQAVAHTESRWHHHPTRLSMVGRQGLFQLSPDRQELAAELLGVQDEVVRHEVTEHARAFAALLDLERPNPEPSENAAGHC